MGGSIAKRRSRKGSRHKYSAREVVFMVLSNSLLYKVCEIIFENCDELIHATRVTRELNISPGYAYLLLKKQKLKKWSVPKGVKNPVNGKLAFRPANSEVAQLFAEELGKRDKATRRDHMHCRN